MATQQDIPVDPRQLSIEAIEVYREAWVLSGGYAAHVSHGQPSDEEWREINPIHDNLGGRAQAEQEHDRWAGYDEMRDRAARLPRKGLTP